MSVRIFVGKKIVGKKIRHQQKIRHFFFWYGSLFFKFKRDYLWNRKNVFISLQKIFSFSRKSKFRILDIQISWLHQMPKHKKNTFYWINWEENSLLMTFGQFISYYEAKCFIKKFYKNASSSSFCACKELSRTSIGNWNF